MVWRIYRWKCIYPSLRYARTSNASRRRQCQVVVDQSAAAPTRERLWNALRGGGGLRGGGVSEQISKPIESGGSNHLLERKRPNFETS